MYRVLNPGGRCFVAEPRYALWASIPLFAMWLLAGVTHSRNGYREPQHGAVFSTSAFETLFAAQPWNQRTIWTDGRYQYALCEKPSGACAPADCNGRSPCCIRAHVRSADSVY